MTTAITAALVTHSISADSPAEAPAPVAPKPKLIRTYQYKCMRCEERHERADLEPAHEGPLSDCPFCAGRTARPIAIVERAAGDHLRLL